MPIGSYAKGFSAPRTDNLYRAPVVEVDPEETNAFDLGVRYTNNKVQAQGTLWKIDYKNRIVTSFNPDYPMIRLATGDLSAAQPGRSPCGRTNMRIVGWLGRADHAAKIKGMFVYPAQVAEVGKRHPELGRLRLAVTRADEQDVMTLSAECASPGDGLQEAVAVTLQSVTKLRGQVTLVAPGSLPNDGKVIADERPVG